MKCKEYANQLIKEGWKVISCEGNRLTLSKNNQQKIIIDLRFDTSVKAAGGGVSNGTPSWGNPTYIYASDSAWATCTVAGEGASGNLIAYNFSFAIPSGATINGISVLVERHASAVSSLNFASQNYLGFWDGATFTTKGDLKSNTTYFGTSDANTVFGSSSDLWGTTWTVANINNSQFGIRLVVNNNNGASRIASIDYVEITITYTPAGAVVYLAGVITGIATTAGFTKILHTLKSFSQGQAGVTGFVKILKTLKALTSGISSVAGLARIFRGLRTSVSGSSVVSAFAKIIKTLQTSISGVCSTIGSLINQKWLVGTIQGIATVSSFIKILKTLSASISGSSIVTGLLGIPRYLVGAISGITSVTGITKIIKSLKVSVSGIASVTGMIGRLYKLSGQIIGNSVVSGFASIIRTLKAVSNGVTFVFGTLTTLISGVWLSAVVAGTSIVTGFISLNQTLKAVVNGIAVVTGTITERILGKMRVILRATRREVKLIESEATTKKEITELIGKNKTAKLIKKRGELQ